MSEEKSSPVSASAPSAHSSAEEPQQDLPAIHEIIAKGLKGTAVERFLASIASFGICPPR